MNSEGEAEYHTFIWTARNHLYSDAASHLTKPESMHAEFEMMPNIFHSTKTSHQPYIFPFASRDLVLCKVKVKFGGGILFGTTAIIGFLYPDPEGVPSFISRGAARRTTATTSASEGRNYEWKFCLRSSNSHKSQGSFTCRKAGTWDSFFYFPSEGRHAEDF
jgi:hypothetical protein